MPDKQHLQLVTLKTALRAMVRVAGGDRRARLPAARDLVAPVDMSPFEPWHDLLLVAARPSVGLERLRRSGWLCAFPEFAALVGCPQDKEWHPEGDVWNHTLQVVDCFAAGRSGDQREDLIVGLACLTHDFGKPLTTSVLEGRICAHGHEKAGMEPARTFLTRISTPRDIVDEVIPLVAEHMRPMMFYRQSVELRAIRRLRHRMGSLVRLVRVARADRQGRHPLPFDGFPAGDWLLRQEGLLDTEPPQVAPIVLGRHLTAIGVQPGPRLGELLRQLVTAQHQGHFNTLEEALDLAKRLLAEDMREEVVP